MAISSKRREQLTGTCECGHDSEAHEHYRAGTECAICDIRQCASFRAVAVEAYTPSR